MFLFVSQEKEIKLLKSTTLQNAVVVEGHIENGLPPYVLLLTKTHPF